VEEVRKGEEDTRDTPSASEHKQQPTRVSAYVYIRSRSIFTETRTQTETYMRGDCCVCSEISLL
jgi:hypothetical protein